MELDHIFLFASPEMQWREFLASVGLVETYKRVHPGQGTANSCYCFENAFLEILWVESLAETNAPVIRRCQFAERSQWTSSRLTSPFGLAWRGESAVKTWPYRPPYLPSDLTIHVAEDSDALDQPFMFSFPGTTAPNTWAESKKGRLQSSSGLKKIFIEEIELPKGVRVSETLEMLQAAGCVEKVKKGERHSVMIRLEHPANDRTIRFVLPELRGI